MAEKEYIETTLTNADSIEHNKIKTHFAYIIVEGTAEKPYYNILWHDITKEHSSIGYGSYRLDFVRRWLEEEFEIVECAADVVLRGVFDQVRWERDVAIEQLEEHGIPFGGIASDVVEVVRCKDCMHCIVTRNDGFMYCMRPIAEEDYSETGYLYPLGVRVGFYDFCSYGEREEDGTKDD